jgi:LemA protein
MGLVLIVILAALGLGIALIYNSLAQLRLLADNAWADIDVQLKRRHDLVPNLVAAVKGHAGYEKGTLESVVSARNQAMRASGPADAARSEADLGQGIGRLIALAEAYPDLKAAASFLELQKNLSEIEDNVQNARRYYNAVVRDLNTRIAQFPANLIAGPLGFRPREFFGIDTGDRAVPELGLESGS